MTVLSPPLSSVTTVQSPSTAALLARLTDLYEQGLLLTGYREGIAQWGDLEHWPGTDGLLLAGRYAVNLGNSKLGRSIHARAYRRDPCHVDARYYFARAIHERRGPLAALRFLRARPLPANVSPRTRCEWLAYEASIHADIRDFATSERLFTEAEALAPNHPWLWVERADALMEEDRYDEALAAVERALSLRSRYRPAVQVAAHLLRLQGRDADAIARLADAARHTENGLIALQLAFTYQEEQQYDEAEHYLNLYQERSPLLTRGSAPVSPEGEEEPDEDDAAGALKMLQGVRADIVYQRGNYAEAVRLARASGGFYSRIADRIESAPPDARRVLLDVPFVRQHHVTCAPATLTAISQFWHRPVDHLSVVEAICYDGTPSHSERQWAEDSGWTTREFTLTWEAAVALLDRGVPFTLATLATEMGHLQAVVGYDARRRTLLMRDPYHRSIGEALMPELIEQQKAGGPRCLALVPQEQAHLLDGLDFPEAPLYDHGYRLQGALLRHDRTAAQAEADQLQAAHPGHRLTWYALRSLAAYDGNRSESLRCVEGLLLLYPSDANLIMARLSLLRDVSRFEDRLRLLEELSQGNDDLLSPRPSVEPRQATPDAEATRRAFDPLFWLQHAEALSDDARTHAKALRLLRRVLRLMPTHANALHLKATIWWDQGKFAQALPLFRQAACLSDKDERLASSYFAAARYLKQSEIALAFLHERFTRLGSRSSQPARTLYPALHDLSRTQEAQQVLDKALALRPQDGELLLFAVEQFAQRGRFDRADALLIAGEETLSQTDQLRARASLASARGQNAESIGLWRAVTQIEPLALDAHHALSELLAVSEGVEATSAHFAALCARFPFHYGLHQMWATALSDAPELTATRGQVLDKLLAINASDSWTRRERAFFFVSERRWPEADAESRAAHALDPRASSVYTVRGLFCAGVKRFAEARNAYQEAVRLAVDNTYAISQWMQLCSHDSERRALLDFVRGELSRQTTYGDGLLAYRTWAADVLSADERIQHLHEALTARPDLWQAWSAVATALRESRRYDDALTFARMATERFPLQPAVWIDLADLHEAREDTAAEQAALQMALQVSPRNGAALRGLCSAYERAGQSDRAVTLLQQAVAAEPLDAANRATLASTLWKRGQREEALGHLKQAVRLMPGYSGFWGMLSEWSRTLGRRGDVLEEARQYVARTPGDARAQLALARAYAQDGDYLAEAFTAYDAAIRLSPRFWQAYEEKADLLIQAGRFDDALVACHPVGGGRAPASLRLCAARVEAARRDIKTGMMALKRLLDEEPNFYDGWQQMASWGYDLEKESVMYRDAAVKMTELRPQDARGWGYLADVREKQQDRTGAKAALKHAFSLNHDYRWAAFRLLKMQREDSEYADAERTYEEMERHQPDAYTTMYGVELACKRSYQPAALERFNKLLFLPLPPGVTRHEDDPDVAHALNRCLSYFDDAKWHKPVLACLREAVTRPDSVAGTKVRPEAGDALVRMAAFLDEWDLLDHILPGLQSRGPLGYEAWSAFLERLSATGRFDNSSQIIERYSAYLRQHNMTWKAGGYALLKMGQPAKAATWFADWRQRVDATPAELELAASAMREVERYSDAHAIHEQALRYPFEDNGQMTPHLLYLALDGAQAGDTEKAAQLLGRVRDIHDLLPSYQFLAVLTQALLAVQQAPAATRAAQFNRAKELLQTARALAPEAREVKALSLAYRMTVDRLAQDVGGPAAKVWALNARRL